MGKCGGSRGRMLPTYGRVVHMPAWLVVFSLPFLVSVGSSGRSVLVLPLQSLLPALSASSFFPPFPFFFSPSLSLFFLSPLRFSRPFFLFVHPVLLDIFPCSLQFCLGVCALTQSCLFLCCVVGPVDVVLFGLPLSAFLSYLFFSLSSLSPESISKW